MRIDLVLDETFIDPKTGKVILKKGEIVTKGHLSFIFNAYGISDVRIKATAIPYKPKPKEKPMKNYVYEAILITKVRRTVVASNEDDAWEELMKVSADQWDTVGVPKIEEIEVLDVFQDDVEYEPF